VNRGIGRLVIWLAGALGALLLILVVMVLIAPATRRLRRHRTWLTFRASTSATCQPYRP